MKDWSRSGGVPLTFQETIGQRVDRGSVRSRPGLCDFRLSLVVVLTYLLSLLLTTVSDPQTLNLLVPEVHHGPGDPSLPVPNPLIHTPEFCRLVNLETPPITLSGTTTVPSPPVPSGTQTSTVTLCPGDTDGSRTTLRRRPPRRSFSSYVCPGSALPPVQSSSLLS